MKFLDLTFPTPQQNLACDEALLEMCERGYDDEILRCWEPTQFFVVLGYSNRAEQHVNITACKHRSVPILRRHSGGGAVVQGPGCLNFALVLRTAPTGPLSTITGTTSYILRRHAALLQRLVPGTVGFQGSCDLTLDGRKFSGNAQRRRVRFTLFHGTFLCGLDISVVGELLRMPPRQPAYRDNRPHQDFLTNLSASSGSIKQALRVAWHATTTLGDIPSEDIGRLVSLRYASPHWTFKHAAR